MARGQIGGGAGVADRLGVRAGRAMCAGTLTPLLRTDAGDTRLLRVDLGAGRQSAGRFDPGAGLRPAGRRGTGPRLARAAGRALPRHCVRRASAGCVLAYHDISDGGLFARWRRWPSPHTAASTSHCPAGEGGLLARPVCRGSRRRAPGRRQRAAGSRWRCSPRTASATACMTSAQPQRSLQLSLRCGSEAPRRLDWSEAAPRLERDLAPHAPAARRAALRAGGVRRAAGRSRSGPERAS